MTKLNWYKARREDSDSRKPASLKDRRATKRQVSVCLSLLRDLNLQRSDDARNLRAMRRQEISKLIQQCLTKRQTGPKGRNRFRDSDQLDSVVPRRRSQSPKPTK